MVPVLHFVLKQTEETGRGIGATVTQVIATSHGKLTVITLTTVTRTITMATGVPTATLTVAQGATATVALRGRGPTSSTAMTATIEDIGTTTMTGVQGEKGNDCRSLYSGLFQHWMDEREHGETY